MNYLFTGSIGAAKTLNAIKFVCEEKVFQGRPVYFYKINKLEEKGKLDWTRISKEQVHKFYELPENSIIFIDEAHEVFPTRTKPPIPNAITEIKQSRVRGYDLIFVTQDPMDLDKSLRRVITQHIHIERSNGKESSKHVIFQECVDDPKDYSARRLAEKKLVSFDKKYYDYYESAKFHTSKKSIRWRFLIPSIIAIGIVLLALLNSISNHKNKPESSLISETPQIYKPETTVDSFFIPKSKKEDEPLLVSDFTPRVPDVPWSAPAYDDLLEVKDFPRPQCIHLISSDTCKCFTQQATPLQIRKPACMNYVYNGYFDPFTDPEEFRAYQRVATGQESEALPSRARSILIPHTPKPRQSRL